MPYRICVNALCLTTGGGEALMVQNHECSGGSPIKGRYVTMQRYNFKLEGGIVKHGSLAMAEVDVDFYV